MCRKPSCGMYLLLSSSNLTRDLRRTEKKKEKKRKADRLARSKAGGYPPSNAATKGSSTVGTAASGAPSTTGLTASGKGPVQPQSSYPVLSGASSLVGFRESAKGPTGTPNVDAARSKAPTPIGPGYLPQVSTGASTAGFPSDSGSVDVASDSMASDVAKQPLRGFRKSEKDAAALAADQEAKASGDAAKKPGGQSSGQGKKGSNGKKW